MKTYNNIVKAIQEVIINHKQLGVNHYFFGEPSDFTEVSKLMPQIIIQPIPFTQTKTNIQYKFRLFYLDIIDADLTNLVDVYSDALQVLNDILNELEYHPDFSAEYALDFNLTFNNFQEKFEELTAGYWCDLVIDTPRRDNRCESPIENF